LLVKLIFTLSLGTTYLSYSMEKNYAEVEAIYARQGRKTQILSKQYNRDKEKDLPRAFPNSWVGNQPSPGKKCVFKECWQQIKKEDQAKIILCITNIVFAFQQGPGWFLRQIDSYETIFQLQVKNYSNTLESIFDKYNIDHPQIKTVQW